MRERGVQNRMSGFHRIAEGMKRVQEYGCSAQGFPRPITSAEKRHHTSNIQGSGEFQKRQIAVELPFHSGFRGIARLSRSLPEGVLGMISGRFYQSPHRSTRVWAITMSVLSSESIYCAITPNALNMIR